MIFITFAFTTLTYKIMKKISHIRHRLTRGQILPPPLSYNLNNNNSRKANKAATPFTLLHLANASCGKEIGVGSLTKVRVWLRNPTDPKLSNSRIFLNYFA